MITRESAPPSVQSPQTQQSQKKFLRRNPLRMKGIARSPSPSWKMPSGVTLRVDCGRLEQPEGSKGNASPSPQALQRSFPEFGRKKSEPGRKWTQEKGGALKL